MPLTVVVESWIHFFMVRKYLYKLLDAIERRIGSRSLINFWVVGKVEMHGERRIRRSEGQDVEKFCESLV